MRKIAILLSVLALLANKYAVGQASNNVVDVYVVGFEKNEQNRSVATLWLNGEAQYLTDGTTDAEAHAVFVSGNDVYVTGYEYDSTLPMTFLKLWKNGVAQNLTNARYANASSVFVSDSDIYVAGFEDNVRTPSIVKLWKNGIAQNVCENGGNAHSVFVSDSDVYIAGNTWNPVFWKNGEKQVLSECSGEACSVFVSGNDVYVAGFENRDLHIETAFVWKNGEKHILNDDEKYNVANSIFVYENDVYVAGWESDTVYATDEDGDTWLNHGTSSVVAKLWKNNIEQNLTDGATDAYANSVYVFDGNIYVAGMETNTQGISVAKLWKNGAPQDLSNGNSEAQAKCVYVYGY